MIGGGPAAYTAAIYLARATLKPLVLAGEAAGGQLMLTTEVENYPGFATGITGPELMGQMRKQAERFGAVMKNVNVTKVDFSQKIKKIWAGEDEYQARTVVLTTGAKPRLLNVGEEKLIGRGVSTCAVCDAAFYKGKKVFVVGGGDVAMEDTLALLKFTKDVTIIHRKNSFRASKAMQKRVLEENKVAVWWDSEVVGVRGESRLEGIRLKNKEGEMDVMAEGLFLAVGHLPATNIFGDQVEGDAHGYIVTRMVKDDIGQRKEWLEGYPTMTSVEGVFAAGDAVDVRYHQVATSVGMGCMAALDVEKYLTGTTTGW